MSDSSTVQVCRGVRLLRVPPAGTGLTGWRREKEPSHDYNGHQFHAVRRSGARHSSHPDKQVSRNYGSEYFHGELHTRPLRVPVPQMTGAIVQILPRSLPELRSLCRLMASTLDPRTGRTVIG